MTLKPRIATLATVALATLPWLCAPAMAQEIESFQVITPNPQPGQDVVLELRLRKAGDTVGCGIKADFGNGADAEVRIGQNGEADLVTTFSTRYPAAGNYSAIVQGVFISRGLRSVPACQGGPRALAVSIGQPGQGATTELQRREAELREREARVRQREAELDRREADLRRREAAQPRR